MPSRRSKAFSLERRGTRGNVQFQKISKPKEIHVLEIPRWLGSKESEGSMRFNWNFWRVEEGRGGGG